MSGFPEFQVKYVSEDPGSVRIEALASGEKGNFKPIFPKVAAEVLFDMTKPFRVLGIPIYVRHSTSIRNSTANVVRIGDRIFLQTANHAFYENIPEDYKPSSSADDELEIDSDSESDTDPDEESNIAITSIASQSPDSWTDRESSDGSECSRRSSLFSDIPTPTVKFPPLDIEATLNDATAKLASLTANRKRFALEELVPTSPKSQCLPIIA